MKNSNLLTLLTILFLSVCGDESDPEDFTFTCVDASECDVITNEDCIDLDTISNIFDFMPIECPGIWVCDFTMFPNSKMNTSSANTRDIIEGGDMLVFQLILREEGDLGLADDEGEFRLAFELAETETSFSLANEGLTGINAHLSSWVFRGGCFEKSLFFPVISGCIQGRLEENDIWRVQANIDIPEENEDCHYRSGTDFRLKVDVRI